MAFSMKLTPNVERILWGAFGGALALAGIGFSYGGWMTSGKATELAQRQADAAVVAALTPICVENFRHAEKADDNLTKLKAINYSYEKGAFVAKGGWATFPDKNEPRSAVAQACADILGRTAM
ncbi:hypothetical protein [Rhodoplanes sp. Z2-YC6860]|uniref:hypothetical protein n=1 Tax=Rhodoplanes sp. Z2-YC6860 TaxID=674703 RepID=UPI00078CF67B|nr:hypothetical protein [Rhodoplanes sp. Z2-YC6860]AMN41915.1 hypothetical protein RHPLAN_34830 [Rhodoplanes sp. Z2-YC6860]